MKSTRRLEAGAPIQLASVLAAPTNEPATAEQRAAQSKRITGANHGSIGTHGNIHSCLRSRVVLDRRKAPERRPVSGFEVYCPARRAPWCAIVNAIDSGSETY